MSGRKKVAKAEESAVLLASRRWCCLCFYLDNREGRRKGQIAHLNRNPSDSNFDNLVWLCLDHHDEYDSRTRQSKGLTPEEVREYRNRLYAHLDVESKRKILQEIPSAEPTELQSDELPTVYETLRAKLPDELGFIGVPWRYPLWQVANEPEFFAYKAGNRADGVCLIERVDLPDGRIVMAFIEMPGNPGQSITNCVEELCFQVCERFEVPAHLLVCLQNYDYDEPQEWNLVSFGQIPPDGPFADPKWTKMTPELWRTLGLKPKRRLTHWGGSYDSKLIKLFEWPTEALPK